MIKIKDIKPGQIIEDVGLITSNTQINLKNVLEFIPSHLEYYGIHDSSKIHGNETFNLIEDYLLDDYVPYCIIKINEAKNDFNEAFNFYNNWKKTNKKTKHDFKTRKLGNVTTGDLIEHGLVAGKEKCILGENIKLISIPSYKIFTYSYMPNIQGSDSPNKFKDRVKIFNDDSSKVNKFIDGCDISIKHTKININETEKFLNSILI